MSEEEFGAMIKDHISALTRNALKFTRDLEDADDLVQDTMVKAIRFYKSYEPGTNITGWLFVIMKNTFINNCRKEARKRALMVQEDEISSANLLYSAERNKATGSMVMEDINKVLGLIPEVNRIPFIRYVEGYKYHEIAEEQQIPLGTVKTRIHEARVMLKKQLRGYDKS
ncbi:RNA polymerase sigma factor (sigma-70 family) [Pedobacter sp. UYEF25]